MKTEIHPQYNATTFTCSCGNVLNTSSALGADRHIEICSQCHPFFKGGGRRVVDTAGRIEKFKRRYQKA